MTGRLGDDVGQRPTDRSPDVRAALAGHREQRAATAPGDAERHAAAVERGGRPVGRREGDRAKVAVLGERVERGPVDRRPCARRGGRRGGRRDRRRGGRRVGREGRGRRGRDTDGLPLGGSIARATGPVRLAGVARSARPGRPASHLGSLARKASPRVRDERVATGVVDAIEREHERAADVARVERHGQELRDAELRHGEGHPRDPSGGEGAARERVGGPGERRRERPDRRTRVRRRAGARAGGVRCDQRGQADDVVPPDQPRQPQHDPRRARSRRVGRRARARRVRRRRRRRRRRFGGAS